MTDYITLMLTDVAAGLILLAVYFLLGLSQPHHRPWAPAFAAVGLVALITGAHMTLAWPITSAKAQWANIAYGEMTLLFGALYLGAAACLARDWHLFPITVVALVSGGMAIVVGTRIMGLGLPAHPVPAGVAFIFSGLGGVLAMPVILLRHWLWQRIVAAGLLLVAAGIWLYTAALAYWAHLASHS